MLKLNKRNVILVLLCILVIMTVGLMFGLSELWFLGALALVAGYCSFLALGETNK